MVPNCSAYLLEPLPYSACGTFCHIQHAFKSPASRAASGCQGSRYDALWHRVFFSFYGKPCHIQHSNVMPYPACRIQHAQVTEVWGVVQACWRAITAKLFCSVITFKATAKGPGKLENSAFRDLWLPGLSFILLMVSVVSCSSSLSCGTLCSNHSCFKSSLAAC